MRLIYHPEAERELLDASLYYEKRLQGLGVEFLDAIDTAAAIIASDPLRHVLYGQEVRRYLLRRFPYAIYYRAVEDEIRILAVKHHARHPDYWQRRKN